MPQFKPVFSYATLIAVSLTFDAKPKRLLDEMCVILTVGVYNGIAYACRSCLFFPLGVSFSHAVPLLPIY
jgi:hypothetical protein